MVRLTAVLFVSVALVSAASASLASRKEQAALTRPTSLAPASRLAGETLTPAITPATVTEFQVTEQTEILLDGKACRYADVPEQATILRMEVSPDRKTVLRIHFRNAR